MFLTEQVRGAFARRKDAGDPHRAVAWAETFILESAYQAGICVGRGVLWVVWFVTETCNKVFHIPVFFWHQRAFQGSFSHQAECVKSPGFVQHFEIFKNFQTLKLALLDAIAVHQGLLKKWFLWFHDGFKHVTTMSHFQRDRNDFAKVFQCFLTTSRKVMLKMVFEAHDMRQLEVDSNIFSREVSFPYI